jgi:sugar/nucleoside kinase (ribokinase family)
MDYSIEEDSLRQWVEFAVHASALVTMKKGSILSLPTLSEVTEFMKNGVFSCHTF